MDRSSVTLNESRTLNSENTEERLERPVHFSSRPRLNRRARINVS